MDNKERLEKIKEIHLERIKQNELYIASFIHVDWLIEQTEKVERYKRVMDKILVMEEYTSTFDHSYYPVSIKEAKKLILELDKPEKEEPIVNNTPTEESYQKIIKILNQDMEK